MVEEFLGVAVIVHLAVERYRTITVSSSVNASVAGFVSITDPVTIGAT
jgi:hypothetical protein